MLSDVLPAARFGESPLMAYRMPVRAAQLRLKYVQKPAFWAAATISVRPDQNLCSLAPTTGTSCVGILHFGPLGVGTWHAV
jgi:hypothetical protein